MTADRTQHLLSIDLEDWFHLLDNDATATPEQWAGFPSRIEENTQRLLDLFETYETRATFFVLGWVAEKFPELVKKVADAGHHIGSHSYNHGLIYEMTPEAFEDDLRRSLDILEDTVGQTITAYRAPGFSITKNCLWAFDILAKHGITHDSSVFPASRAHGGLPGFPEQPFLLETDHGIIKEFPISTARAAGKQFVFAGGGYFRLFPLWYLNRQFRKYSGNEQPVITYLHPRDFDHAQPKLDLPPARLFKSYVGLKGSLSKLEALLKKYAFTDIDSLGSDGFHGQVPYRPSA